MGISPKLLSEGERVVATTRTHWKALVIPVLVLIVTCAAAGFLIAVLPDGSSHTILLIVVLVVAAAIVIWFTIRPFLIWLTASYTVTNRRLINRSGVFRPQGPRHPAVPDQRRQLRAWGARPDARLRHAGDLGRQ